MTLWRWRLPWRKRTWHHRKSENFQMSTLFVSQETISQTVHERTIWNLLFAKKDTRKWDRLKSLFFTTTYLSVLKSSNYLSETSAKIWLYILQSHICQLRKLPEEATTSGRNVQWTLWTLSHLRLFLHLMDRELTITNDKILGFPTLTHRRHLPQNLLNYLSIYWTTSESTELPENLLNYLRIYWTTWEFTELPENLLNYLGNYWTTWKFYWTTWEITELPENFTELPQIFTELPGFLQVQIIVLPGPAEVY